MLNVVTSSFLLGSNGSKPQTNSRRRCSFECDQTELVRQHATTIVIVANVTSTAAAGGAAAAATELAGGSADLVRVAGRDRRPYRRRERSLLHGEPALRLRLDAHFTQT